MRIAKLYGMISPAETSTSAVRAVFIIDDKQILRLILYYPLEIGRNIQEIIRIIDALQTVDKYKVLAPANWYPGMPVIVPPPKTYPELKQRLKNVEGYNCTDWYLCYKKV
ncbi:hypothetical protein [Aceticella autotrophica]|uniref:hypothetical protein n=1 Tax=Aceticella autotrophica TaxID=2755338 RepID=UPI003D6E76F5